MLARSSLLLLSLASLAHGFADPMTHFQYKDSNHRVESLGSIALNTIGELGEVVKALERQATGEEFRHRLCSLSLPKK